MYWFAHSQLTAKEVKDQFHAQAALPLGKRKPPHLPIEK
jgi:hypothetical protein